MGVPYRGLREPTPPGTSQYSGSRHCLIIEMDWLCYHVCFLVGYNKSTNKEFLESRHQLQSMTTSTVPLSLCLSSKTVNKSWGKNGHMKIWGQEVQLQDFIQPFFSLVVFFCITCNGLCERETTCTCSLLQSQFHSIVVDREKIA